MSAREIHPENAPRTRPAPRIAAAPGAAIVEETMKGKQVLAAAGLAALGAAAALAAALLSSEAHAAHAPRVEREWTADRGPIAVEVLVAGRTTPLFMAANRRDRWYLEAKQGRKYELRVRNTSGERIGFVLAVDGLNAIDGTLSRNASTEPMYVLEPYADATIKGWRKNLDQVSRFVFVDERRSYAERTGQGNGDLGWIRVTAFHEVWHERWGRGDLRMYRDGGGARGGESRESRESREEMSKDEAAPPSAQAMPESRGRVGSVQGRGTDIAPAPSSPSREPVAESNPGTGWGPNQRDHVRRVEFTPRAHAAAQVVLRYEYKPALVALGILPWREPVDRTWERDHGVYGFAQPPPPGR